MEPFLAYMLSLKWRYHFEWGEFVECHSNHSEIENLYSILLELIFYAISTGTKQYVFWFIVFIDDFMQFIK